MKWSKINLQAEKYSCLKEPGVNPIVEKLYISGQMPDLENTLAVVGSRKISEYGKRVCREFVEVIASSGITIVSGLMYGADLEAHNAALKVGGKTIGVLGYGFEHLKTLGYANNLYKKIIETKSGAVVTEFDPDVPPAKWTFPQRNRIISALSKAILVIEASENSGSLITAGYGAEQGKDVFAIPGSIFSINSKGTNWVIKQGAHIATTPDDILLYFNKTRKFPEDIHRKLDKKSVEILNHIETLDKSANIQKLSELVNIPAYELGIKISELELAGCVSKDISGRLFVIK